MYVCGECVCIYYICVFVCWLNCLFVCLFACLFICLRSIVDSFVCLPVTSSFKIIAIEQSIVFTSTFNSKSTNDVRGGTISILAAL